MELGAKEVRKVMKEIQKKTAIPVYSLRINPDKEPELYDSKFGGMN